MDFYFILHSFFLQTRALNHLKHLIEAHGKWNEAGKKTAIHGLAGKLFYAKYYIGV